MIRWEEQDPPNGHSYNLDCSMNAHIGVWEYDDEHKGMWALRINDKRYFFAHTHTIHHIQTLANQMMIQCMNKCCEELDQL